MIDSAGVTVSATAIDSVVDDVISNDTVSHYTLVNKLLYLFLSPLFSLLILP